MPALDGIRPASVLRICWLAGLLLTHSIANAADSYLSPSEVSGFRNSIEAKALEARDLLDQEELRLHLYPINGRDEKTLTAQMLEAGPVDNEGAHRFALLHWHIKWRWQDSEDLPPRRTLRVQHTSYLKIPFWADQNESTPELRASWSRFYQAMLSHEGQHFAYAHEYADKIRREVGAEVRNSPGISGTAINQNVSRFLNELRAVNRRYDHDTQHGKTQGVTLRPYS